MLTRSSTAIALALSIASTAGCLPSIHSATQDAARAGTPVVVDKTLESAEDPATRARVAALLATPEMRQATQELAAGLAEGAARGLSSAESEAAVDAMVDRFTRAAAASLARSIDTEMAPVIARATRRAVGEALEEASTPEHRAALVALSAQVMTESLRAAFTAMKPELRDALRSQEAQESIRFVAKQAVLGSNDALTDLAEKKARDQGGGPLGSLLGFFFARSWLLALLTAAVVLGVPLGWLLRERRRAARIHAIAEKRQVRAAAILEALEAGGDGPWRKDVLALLRSELTEDVLTDPAASAESAPRRPAAAGA